MAAPDAVRPRTHRRVQRGRRPGHPGPAGLAGRPPPRRSAVASVACSTPRTSTPSSMRGWPPSTPTAPSTPEHLLGDLLGYWVREFRAHKAPKLASTCLETAELLDDPDVLGRARVRRARARYGAKGQELKSPGRGSACPTRPSRATSARDGASVLYGLPDGPTGYASIAEIDEATGEVVLVWNDKAARARASIPRPSAIDDWVSPQPEAGGARRAGRRRARHAGLAAPPNPASMSLLRRDDPAFTAGRRPARRQSSPTTSTRCAGGSTQLDGSCISIQGPPGTGKTYWGAHLVHSARSAPAGGSASPP